MQSGKIRFASLLLPTLMLAACGGGGSDATEDTTTPPVTAPTTPAVSRLVITTANAQPVAADALQTTGTNGVAAVGTGLVTGVPVQGAATGANPATLARAGRVLLARRPVGAPLAASVSASGTAACTGGGSIVVTVTNGVGQQSLAMNASGCIESVDGVSSRMDGRITVTVVGSYDPNALGPQSFDLTIVANGFALTQTGLTTVSDGTLHLNFSDDRSGQVVVLRSDALSSSVSDASGTRSVTLKNYFQQVTTDATRTTSTQVTADVETRSARLGSGTVAYRIAAQAQPLVIDGNGVYRSGALQVTGQGSGLLLTVTGPDLFQLQVDTDGDGNPDAGSTVTRAQLNAAL